MTYDVFDKNGYPSVLLRLDDMKQFNKRIKKRLDEALLLL